MRLRHAPAACVVPHSERKMSCVFDDKLINSDALNRIENTSANTWLELAAGVEFCGRTYLYDRGERAACLHREQHGACGRPDRSNDNDFMQPHRPRRGVRQQCPCRLRATLLLACTTACTPFLLQRQLSCSI